MHEQMMRDGTILILGGGPAGGAVALGLRQLGYEVTLVAEPRPFMAVEGISEAVVEELRKAGFSFALRDFPGPSVRTANWNGDTSSISTERLINRTEMDKDILLDLKSSGVHVIEGRAGKITAFGNGYQVEVVSGDHNLLIPARFMVEARGRSASSAGLQSIRGVETVSLLQYWQGEPCEPQSASESYADGWAWMAAWSDGTQYLQLTFDVATTDLPKKSQLVDYATGILHTLKNNQSFMQGAAPTGEIHARTSTPTLCCEAVSDDWIRIGDAAMSADPISGSGIYQTLSSTLHVPAVINTLIQQPHKTELAKRFYQERLNNLFYRFARKGRDLLAAEQQWPASSFWSMRRSWPDLQPVQKELDPAAVHVAMRPVALNGLIVEEEVVITNDAPLGILHLNGMAMAPVAKAIQQRRKHEPVENCLAREAGIPPEQSGPLAQWLYSHKWVA